MENRKIKIEPPRIDESELSEMVKLKERDFAEEQLIQELLHLLSIRKEKIISDKRNWWKGIYKKYVLDPNKDYNLNVETGILNEKNSAK